MLAEQRFDAFGSCRNLVFEAENQGFAGDRAYEYLRPSLQISVETKLALLLGSRVSASYVEHVC